MQIVKDKTLLRRVAETAWDLTALIQYQHITNTDRTATEGTWRMLFQSFTDALRSISHPHLPQITLLVIFTTHLLAIFFEYLIRPEPKLPVFRCVLHLIQCKLIVFHYTSSKGSCL